MPGSVNGDDHSGRGAHASRADVDPHGIQALCACHENRPDALLEILHAVQERVGYVPPEALATIAAALNLSRAEVHGVVSYYHDFHTAPQGRHVVKLCRAEACQAVGAQALYDHICASEGIGTGGTTTDGALTVEAAYCLGNCALGPAALVDGRLVARLTRERIDAIAAGVRADAPQAAE